MRWKSLRRRWGWRPQEESRKFAQAKRAEAAPLTELMAQAARFYQQQLKTAPEAIDYLKQRGLTGEIAKH